MKLSTWWTGMRLPELWTTTSLTTSPWAAAGCCECAGPTQRNTMPAASAATVQSIDQRSIALFMDFPRLSPADSWNKWVEGDKRLHPKRQEKIQIWAQGRPVALPILCKFQITNHKSQTSTKFQAPKLNGRRVVC